MNSDKNSTITIEDYQANDCYTAKYSEDSENFISEWVDHKTNKTFKIVQGKNLDIGITNAISIGNFEPIFDNTKGVGLVIEFDCPFLFPNERVVNTPLKYDTATINYKYYSKKKGQEIFSTLNVPENSSFSSFQISFLLSDLLPTINKQNYASQLITACREIIQLTLRTVNDKIASKSTTINLEINDIFSYKIHHLKNYQTKIARIDVLMASNKFVHEQMTTREEKPEFVISDLFVGKLTAHSLLQNETGLLGVIPKEFVSKQYGTIVLLKGYKYKIHLFMDGDDMVFNVNDNIIRKSILDYTQESDANIYFYFYKGYNFICLDIGGSGKKFTEPYMQRKTIPVTLIPNKLIKWVNQITSTRIEIYKDKAQLHDRVISIFQSINDTINNAPLIKNFYKTGKSLDIAKDPVKYIKHETEIRDLIISLLQNKIQVVSGLEMEWEQKTTRGDIDIVITGDVSQIGKYSILIECKKDTDIDKLCHGFAQQLPTYMEIKNVEFGIYLVLQVSSNPQSVILSEIADRELKRHPLSNNITIISLDLRFKPTASKI